MKKRRICEQKRELKRNVHKKCKEYHRGSIPRPRTARVCVSITDSITHPQNPNKLYFCTNTLIKLILSSCLLLCFLFIRPATHIYVEVTDVNLIQSAKYQRLRVQFSIGTDCREKDNAEMHVGAFLQIVQEIAIFDYCKNILVMHVVRRDITHGG